MSENREDISRASELFEIGDYHESLKIVEAIRAGSELPDDERLSCSLLECRLRMKLGEAEKALSLSEELMKIARDEKDVLLSVDVLIVRAEASWRSGSFDSGLEAVREADELLSKTKEEDAREKVDDIKRREMTVLRHRGILHWYKGELDQAAECHKQSMEVSRELDYKEGIASALNNLGLVYWSKGELEKAAEFYKQSLAIREELGSKPEIAVLLNNLGNVHVLIGDLDRALEYHEHSLQMRTDLDSRQDIATSLINVGSIYQMKGYLDRAIDKYNQSLKICREQGSRQNEALALNNIGSVYSLTGELEQALDYHRQSLEIKEQLGNSQDIALSLINMGEIYRRMGSLQAALEDYKRGLSIYEEVGNEPYIAITLYHQMWLALDLKDEKRTQFCLSRLKEISEKTDNRVIGQRYRVAKALSLKASKRVRDKLKAQEILEELVEEDVADHSLTVTAMIQLCELLLVELKMSEEDVVLRKVMALTGRLHDIAKEQSSHSLLVETYLLQSKLAVIELDLDRARIILAQAHITAKERGLHMLTHKVAHERELLASQLSKWETLVEQNPSTKDMIGMTRLDDLLERMIRKTVTVLTEEEKSATIEETHRDKYRIVHLDYLEESEGSEKSNFRVGIAQIGLSQGGDILDELYMEKAPGLFGIHENEIQSIWSKALKIIKEAQAEGINILLFPELTIDFSYSHLLDEAIELARTNRMYIIPGSFHESNTRRNICRVIGPNGVVWEQEKHIPAIIHFDGKKIKEGIETESSPKKTIVCNTEYGRIAIAICRDFLDMDLRVELKNSDPPVDLVINPAFTPVTADFEAVHFDARRSIYAYCFFANVAEFGDSRIYSPEKDRAERRIPAGEEGLIYKDVDLFQLRSERKRWEEEQKKQKSFIQSTR